LLYRVVKSSQKGLRGMAMSLSSMRDIALVALAFEGFIIGLVFLVLGYGAMWAMRKLRRWLGEHISKGVDLLRQLRARVEEISFRVAGPIITVESSIAAVKGTYRHIRSRLSRGGGSYA